MLDILVYWCDTIWIPILFFGVHKQHRWWTVGFVTFGMIISRLMAEMISSFGFPNGIMGFIETDVYIRGIIVSSFFYALFLLMAHFSRRTEGVVFMAACLSFFFMIFICCSFVMVL